MKHEIPKLNPNRVNLPHSRENVLAIISMAIDEDQKCFNGFTEFSKILNKGDLKWALMLEIEDELFQDDGSWLFVVEDIAPHVIFQLSSNAVNRGFVIDKKNNAALVKDALLIGELLWDISVKINDNFNGRWIV